jgi:dihydroflavonol-4-reductase
VSAPRVLLTGATGFLGRHVIAALRAARPDSVLLALIRPASAPEPVPDPYLDRVEIVPGTPLEPDGWINDPRLEALDVVFHLAAEVVHSRRNAEGMVRFNVDSTVRMMRFATERGARMVFASTSGTVGASKNPGYAPDEDAPWCEDIVRYWPYYASKVEAERQLMALAKSGGQAVILRPPVLLGPGDHRFRSTGVMLRLLTGRLPMIVDGQIHFTDIRDAAAAMVQAGLHANPKQVYNLPGTVCSLDEFFRMVARHAGLPVSWKKLPGGLMRMLSRVNDFTGLRLHILPDPVLLEAADHYWGLSTRYASADLSYAPRSADETVGDTVTWLRRHHPKLKIG